MLSKAGSPVLQPGLRMATAEGRGLVMPGVDHRVLHVDERVAELLGAIDGRRDVRALARELDPSEDRSEWVSAALSALGSAGCLADMDPAVEPGSGLSSIRTAVGRSPLGAPLPAPDT